MRRYLPLILAFISLALSAQSNRVEFHQKDGATKYQDYTLMDSVRFNNSETIASFYMRDIVAHYPINRLDSITFKNRSADATTFTTHETVMGLYEQFTLPEGKSVGEESEENYSQTKTIIITYNGNKASVNNQVSGVSINISGANVSVTSTTGKVRYRLTGTTYNGSFKIESNSGTPEENKKCIIELYNVNITNPYGPAINIQSGKSIYLNIGSNTKNSLTDGPTYFTTNPNEDAKGTLFSEGQLIIDGGGTLNITSYGGHALCSDDYIYLRKTCGDINIKSKRDGIHTKDYFIMYGGTLNIDAEDDGISVSKGYINIYGGKTNITAKHKGMVADYSTNDSTHIDIYGGYTQIQTSGDKGHAITTTGKLNIVGGVIDASTSGEATKCILSDDIITIENSTLKLRTAGNPLYNATSIDYSTSAAIRSKRDLNIKGSDIAMLSSGNGAKAINVEGTITIEKSHIIAITQGDSHISEAENIHPRAINAGNLTINSGGYIYISSSHAAIHTTGNLYIGGGETTALSSNSAIKSVNVKGNATQTNGILVHTLRYE